MVGKVLGFIFLFLLVTFGIGFIATGGDLITYEFWAPKQANAQREVFQNSQSYIQGKVEYLNQLRMAYTNAEGDQQQALRQTILTEAATVDQTKLPASLQFFLRSLQ